MPETSYAIALGSNRRHGRHGAPERVIAAALAALPERGVRVVRRSRIVRTAALGPAGRGFANAAAVVATGLDPAGLLKVLKEIERAFGRRPGRRWGARVIDLDVILWEGGRWPTGLRGGKPGALRVPHREYAGRAFVLDPLVAVAAGWRDPWSGRTVRQARALLALSR